MSTTISVPLISEPPDYLLGPLLPSALFPHPFIDQNGLCQVLPPLLGDLLPDSTPDELAPVYLDLLHQPLGLLYKLALYNF